MAVYTFGGNVVQPAQLDYYAYLSISADVQLSWPYSFKDIVNPVAIQMDVSTTIADVNFTLPSALETGVGTSFFFRNVGSETFNVNDNDGGLISTVSATEGEPNVVYFYLTDNSTPAGTWGSFVFGAGSSSADAEALAGYGLVALDVGPPPAKLNTVFHQVMELIDFTIDGGYMSAYVICPNPITATVVTGLQTGLFIAFSNQSSGIVTVTPTGCLIDRSSDNILLLPRQSIQLVTDGTDWFSLGFNTTNPRPASEHVITLTSPTYVINVDVANTFNILVFIGNPTANCAITIPGNPGMWAMHNQTAFNLIITSSLGGASVTLQPDERQTVYYNVNDGNLYTIPEIPLPINQGGTGQPTQLAAFNALSPTAATGDMIYRNNVGNNVALNLPGAPSSYGSTLINNATGPTWYGSAIVNTNFKNLATSGLITTLPTTLFSGGVTLTKSFAADASYIWIQGVVNIAPSSDSADTIIVSLQVSVDGHPAASLFKIAILTTTASSDLVLTSIPINYLDTSVYPSGTTLDYTIVVTGAFATSGNAAYNRVVNNATNETVSHMLIQEMGNIGSWEM